MSFFWDIFFMRFLCLYVLPLPSTGSGTALRQAQGPPFDSAVPEPVEGRSLSLSKGGP
jgi:hypothetical protein